VDVSIQVLFIIFIVAKYVKRFVTSFHEITELLLEDRTFFFEYLSSRLNVCTIE